MVCTDTQVRLLMKERQQGRTQEQAAAKANVKSRKKVDKVEKQSGAGDVSGAALLFVD